ncbi:MAG: YlbF family regulator [Clostridia bacterium]|nr:YlbF family regulator [Clostridia bacterium]
MREVMTKAQELAEAILASAVYRKMKELEGEVRRDPEAANALGQLIEKRSRVENILSDSNMDPEELKKASLEMEEAEKAMNQNEKIQALREARKDFQTMMDNVNKILRLVVTGEVAEERETGRAGGCSGSCAGCSGCQ